MLCPVVLIQTPAGLTRINESDYDPTKHVLCDETGAPINGAGSNLNGASDANGTCLHCGAPEGELHREGCQFFQPATDDLASNTVVELRALAADRKIDLGDATKKADIIAAIEAAKAV